MTNPHLSLDQQILGDIYSSRAGMDNLEVLCDEFGSRFGGTEGEKLAADFIAAKYEEYGLKNVHLEPFEYLGWRRGDVKLEIVEPIQKQIPCITLPHSPPCKVEAEVFYIGEGHPDDFDKHAEKIKGKFLMTNSVLYPKKSPRWIHRQEKFGRSLLAGAAGFIFVNHYPGFGPATGGIGSHGMGAPIPGVSVSKENGDLIQRLAKKHGKVKMRITSNDKLEPMTSWNVVGELPGTEHPDEIILIGSHYDGHDISQGASDPASGVVSVLEAARVLSKYAQLPRTVRFVMWGVEEIGLLGSQAYANAHADELQNNVRFYLNMDGAGGMPVKDINLHGWHELQQTFEKYRAEMALDFAIGQSFHSASDHYPLLLKGAITGGVEPVRQVSSGRGYGHTQFDTVDKVTLQGIRDAASLAARIVLRVSLEDNWPATPRDASTVDELLNQPARTEIMKYQAKMAEYHSKR